MNSRGFYEKVLIKFDAIYTICLYNLSDAIMFDIFSALSLELVFYGIIHEIIS